MDGNFFLVNFFRGRILKNIYLMINWLQMQAMSNTRTWVEDLSGYNEWHSLTRSLYSSARTWSPRIGLPTRLNCILSIRSTYYWWRARRMGSDIWEGNEGAKFGLTSMQGGCRGCCNSRWGAKVVYRSVARNYNTETNTQEAEVRVSFVRGLGPLLLLGSS